jgi:hypothetical protein
MPRALLHLALLSAACGAAAPTIPPPRATPSSCQWQTFATGSPGLHDKHTRRAGWNDLLESVWLDDADDAWVAGWWLRQGDHAEPDVDLQGRLYHWDGHTFSDLLPREVAQPLGNLHAVWGIGHDVFAAGLRTIVHADGAGIHVIPIDAEIRAIWGARAESVWFAGTKVFHLDAAGLHEERAPGLLAGIWGSSDDDLWAVGDEDHTAADDKGTLYHRVRGAWEPVMTPVPHLSAIHGSAPDDVWAVGGDEHSLAVLRFDGHAWSVVLSAIGSFGLEVRGPENAAGMPPKQVERLTGVYAAARDDVWIAGAREGLLHWDGHAWRWVTLGENDEHFRAVHGARGEIWAVGDGGEVVRCTHRRD